MKILPGKSEGHIVEKKVYLYVLTALLLLTILTVVTAKFKDFHDLLAGVHHALPFAFAMLIAIAKASLVVLFFMHIKYENKSIAIYGIYFPIVLFLTLVVLSLLDVHTRITL